MVSGMISWQSKLSKRRADEGWVACLSSALLPRRTLESRAMPKMRDYVDGIRGPGTWDQMHDKIDRKEVFGWEMPPVEVDGIITHIFPGEDREVTLEQVKDSIRRALLEIADPNDMGKA